MAASGALPLHSGTRGPRDWAADSAALAKPDLDPAMRPSHRASTGRRNQRKNTKVHFSFQDDTIEWATKKLMPLFRLRGAPKSLLDQEHFAEAVLRIAHPQLVALRSKDAFAKIPLDAITAALKLSPKELAAVQVEQVNPLDWLVKTVADESRWFMEPVDMRAVFIEKFPCADGKKHVNERSPGKEREK